MKYPKVLITAKRSNCDTFSMTVAQAESEFVSLFSFHCNTISFGSSLKWRATDNEVELFIKNVQKAAWDILGIIRRTKENHYCKQIRDLLTEKREILVTLGK